MYDGYYIYSEYYNDIIKDYQYGLKPFIYYSCRYKKGNNDFVVNYTLDNTITIYGIIDGKYQTKTGTLINPSNVSDIKVDGNGNAISLIYDGALIEREILTEQLITLDGGSNASRNEYEYTVHNNRKIYKDNVGYFWNSNNKKQYITDSDTLKFVNSMTTGGHLYSNSAVQYYKNAYDFSIWINSHLGNITQIDALDSDGNPINDFAVNTGEEEIFLLNEDNDPTKEGSTFQENRISVIRKSIISNLSTAIANFNTSAHTYEFVMPIFNEEDWEKITSNIAVASFMQGIPIGSKYYNNYCIITNDKNKEFISEDSIYVITEDGQVHLPTCKKIIEEDKKVIQAYNNVDFERQTISSETILVPGQTDEVKEVHFYPHANEKCYYCMVNSVETYDINDIIRGKITQYNKNTDEYEKNIQATNRLSSTNLRKDYLTALARKRYELIFINTEAENSLYTYRTEPVITSVTPTPTTVTIRAVGDVNDIVGYAVTEANVAPSSFTNCTKQSQITVTQTGLIPERTYYAWVKDEIGNISKSQQFTTKVIGNIIFNVTPSTWTNGDVIVTATNVGGMTLQTSTDGSTWQDTSSQKLTQNGTVYARIKDYTSETASVKVTNIDKIAPTISNVEITSNRATVIATDNANGSGIAEYAITEANVKPVAGFQKSNVFENLAQNTTYYAWVKDNVGNVSEGRKFTIGSVAKSEGNITFKYEPQGPTNRDVVVTSDTTENDYTIETSKDGITWEKTTTQTLTDNGTIYSKLVDSTGQSNGVAQLTVNNIDKTPPIIQRVETTTNSATIIATDAGGSVIAGYKITETNTRPTDGYQESNVFTGLKQNTVYYAWVIDKAGNISDGSPFTVGEVASSLGNIIFTYTPTTWTNASVTVTATATISGYTLQTSKNGISWTTTASQTLDNNGIVYARLVDSAGQSNGMAQLSITNIDKILPTISNVSVTSNSATIIATDAGGSGIAGYAMTTNNSKPTTGFKTTNTFTGLKQNITYYAWVKDNAGNINNVDSKNTFKVQVTSATGNITFAYNPQKWTNGNVVAFAYTTVDGYTLKTSTNGRNWTNATSQTFNSNGTFYAKLEDSTGQSNGMAQLAISNIDKMPPTVDAVETTTNSATITATDVGGSQVTGYAVTTTPSKPALGQFTSSNTIGNLTQSTTYYAWVRDGAGNISNINSNSRITTQTVPLSSNITITYTPHDWTNQYVTVTASANISNEFSIVTSKDGGRTWSNTSTQVFDENNTFCAKIVDSTGQYNGIAQRQITNIDKTPPTVNSVSASGTTAWINATDGDGSGIAGYALTTTTAQPSYFQRYNSFSLSVNITYYAWVKDNAGNISNIDYSKGTVKVEHVHTDSCYHKHIEHESGQPWEGTCYRPCGAQLYTPYDNHEFHKCENGHLVGNSVWDWHEKKATPGDKCNEHYGGKCEVGILNCNKEGQLICGY